MTTYEIEQTDTAVILWRGEAPSEQVALDAMARDAGYIDYNGIPEEIGGRDTIVVRQVLP